MEPTRPGDTGGIALGSEGMNYPQKTMARWSGIALFLVIVLLPLAAMSFPIQEADACEPRTDFLVAPENIQPYDAANAPEPPVIVDAFVSHSDGDDGAGCGASSGCNSFHGLNVLVSGVAQDAILRVTDEDGSITYAARGIDIGDGQREIFLAGYGDVDEDMPFRLAIIDANGFPSQDVEYIAFNEEPSDAGCSAGGNGGSSLLLSLMVLVGLFSRRRSSREN